MLTVATGTYGHEPFNWELKQRNLKRITNNFLECVMFASSVHEFIVTISELLLRQKPLSAIEVFLKWSARSRRLLPTVWIGLRSSPSQSLGKIHSDSLYNLDEILMLTKKIRSVHYVVMMGIFCRSFIFTAATIGTFASKVSSWLILSSAWNDRTPIAWRTSTFFTRTSQTLIN